MVFYNRTVLTNNEDLIEIKDKEFLTQLKADFNNNYKHFGSQTPIICGSIVNKAHY